MRASGTNLLALAAAAVVSLGLGSARCALAAARGVATAASGVATAASGATAGCDASAERVMRLADRRLSLMPAVAAWKWQHHAAVTAPAREQAVMQRAGELARPLGLSAPSVARLFALEVRLAREEEARLQRRWHTRGFDYQGPAPSLTAVLRPQLDDITTQLLMALSAAVPELARPDFIGREAPCAAHVLHADGWSGAARAELLRDLHAIGTTASRPRELRP